MSDTTPADTPSLLPPALALEEEPFDPETIGADGEAGEPASRWSIEDDGAAEWAMRHLAEVGAELAGLDAQAEEWQFRINEWREKRAAPLVRRATFFEGALMAYLRRRREASDGQVKTLVLPSGEVKSRVVNPRVEVGDQPEFSAWADEHPDDPLVRTTRQLNAAALKSRIEVTETLTDWTLITLSCGHEVLMIPDQTPLPNVGDSCDCSRCSGEEGWVATPLLPTVTQVLTESRVHRTVRDADTGYELAWATVRPGDVSYSVHVYTGKD